MDPKSGKPLRLFINPFAIWADLALKTGEAMIASAHALASEANARRKVAVIPAADAPALRAQAISSMKEAPAKASRKARAKVKAKARPRRKARARR